MKVNEGDIFLIPSDNKQAVAKVIFLSTYFKDVMLINIFQKNVKGQVISSDSLPECETLLMYTAVEAAEKGNWELLGSQEVTQEESDMTKRIVGGGIWIRDEYLGEYDRNTDDPLPKMLTYGYKLIRKRVEKL